MYWYMVGIHKGIYRGRDTQESNEQSNEISKGNWGYIRAWKANCPEAF